MGELTAVRSVKRSSVIRLEFFIRPKENNGESKKPFGFIEFDVEEVADFERLLGPGKILFTPGFPVSTDLPVSVNVRKKMRGGSLKTTSGNEVTFSATWSRKINLPFSQPPDRELPEDQEQRRRSELPLANYIISHPIPEGWELRRKTNDGVYFFNLKDSKPTAVLWYDPLHKVAPESKLAPLPPTWKRIAENGQILYRRDLSVDSGRTTLQFPPEALDPMTFENVLKPVQHHFPGSFFVDES